MIFLFWWRLPGLLIRRLLRPLEGPVDYVCDETEKHIADQEKYYSDIGAKVARNLNEAWTHTDGNPVYANEGREN